MSGTQRWQIINVDGITRLVPEGTDYRLVEDWNTLPRLAGRSVTLADEHFAALARVEQRAVQQGVKDERARIRKSVEGKRVISVYPLDTTAAARNAALNEVLHDIYDTKDRA
jgi:hypothetical protein